MRNKSFKNVDNLIQGIKEILSNYRCSFSEKERILLNDCIRKLEDSRTIEDLHLDEDIFIEVLGNLIKVFTIAEHLKNLF